MAIIKAKNIKNFLFIAILLTLVFCGTFIVNRFKPEIYAQMDKWKLIPQKERFTELYFENHLNLPKLIIPGREMNFSFTIHNLEGEATNYPFVIYFVSEEGRIAAIESSRAALADGEYKTIPVSYTLNTEAKSGAIYVELTNKKQDIHFIVNK